MNCQRRDGGVRLRERSSRLRENNSLRGMAGATCVDVEMDTCRWLARAAATALHEYFYRA